MFEESTEAYVSSTAMKLASCAMLSLNFVGTCPKRRSKAREEDSLGAGTRVDTSQPISQRLPRSGLLLFNSSYRLMIVLALLKLMFMLWQKGCFPTLAPVFCFLLASFLIRKFNVLNSVVWIRFFFFF